MKWISIEVEKPELDRYVFVANKEGTEFSHAKYKGEYVYNNGESFHYWYFGDVDTRVRDIAYWAYPSLEIEEEEQNGL